MRLQIASDLHLEYFQDQWPGFRLIEPHPEAEALALAGDIAHAAEAVALFADWPVPVIYVSGNHEPYDADRIAVVAALRREAQGTPVHFLENDWVGIGGVRFLGATLWTDFSLLPGEQEAAIQRAQDRRSDYKRIGFGDRLLRARDTVALHAESRAFFSSVLDRPFSGRTVVITHHAPHGRSLTPDWAQSIQGTPFAADCSELFGKVDLWVHGHVHHSRDYSMGGARIVANPCGYLEQVRATGYPRAFRMDGSLGVASDWENSGFNPSLLIDV